LVVVRTAAPASDEFQAAVERVMAGQAGTAVVVEVDSGRLLASYRLEAAARTLVSPGSTLKPFTLAALLESGKLKPEAALVCRRRVRIGGQSLDCTHVTTVEPIDPVAALAYSCNYFFAENGRLLEAGDLVEALRRAGLASPSKLVGEEASGSVRIPASEEETQLEALGHSGVETTPLALLMAYRQMALKRKQPGHQRLEPVFAGLEAATEYGTGQLARPEGLRVAGKTGTARARTGTWTHAWFVGYAPADKPEIAIVVFLEHGRGGSDAAPLAREIFAAWHKQRSGR
jgi:cell division protein FtsI/penicillin-binding protein 2